MSFAIVERTVSAETDKRIILKNGQIIRPITLGTWTRIRLGMRIAVQGSTVPSPFNLFIGLCSGTTQGWASEVTTHAVGVWWSTPAVTYTAGPPTSFLTGASSMFFYKKISQTKTLLNASTTGHTTNNYFAANADTRNCIHYFEFRKVSGTTWGMTQISPHNTLANSGDRTSDVFRNSLIANTAANCGSAATLTVGTERTGTVDEATNGTLDAVNIHWVHPTIGLELGSVTISKLD